MDVKALEKSGYRFSGEAAVKICEWTRKSLRGQGVCYKQKWYGIESHRCMQCTLSLRCNTRCSYCWRSFKAFGGEARNAIEPEAALEGLTEKHRDLLSGFGGHENKRMWKEANAPTNVAISLIGESLFYPRLDDFMRLVHRKGGSTFLVTKGTLPEALTGLDTLPTSLYISVCAPDRVTFNALDRPLVKDGWERQMRSLEIMHDLGRKCRRVLRMTLVKNKNMKRPDAYAKLIEKAEPDFIELKAYMYLGESQTRLPKEAMPYAEDVKRFASEVANASGYVYKDFFGPSRVVLLAKK